MYNVNQDGTVTLDSGEIISVEVTTERLPNGGGMVFKAKAEHSPDVISETTYTADIATINTYGDAAIARGLLKAVLGEPVDCDALMFSQDFLDNVSIRNHISLANSPALDAASLL